MMTEPSKPPARGTHDIINSLLGWASIGILGILVALLFGGLLDVPRSTALVLGTGMFLVMVLVVVRLGRGLSGPGMAAPRPDSSTSRLSSRPLDYLVSLLNVSRAVSADASITELGQIIVDSCRDSFDCDEVSLMMVDPSGGELGVTAFAGHRDVSKIRNAKVKVGEGVAGTVARTRRPIILGPTVDTGQFPGFQAKSRHIQFSMVAPIIVRDRLAGVLNVSASSAEVVFTEDDLRVLCILAEHAGIAAAKSRDSERISRLIRRVRQRHRRRLDELQARLDAATGVPASASADSDEPRAAA